MRISDWSSDVCSSDLVDGAEGELAALGTLARVRHGVEQPGDLGAGEVGVEQQAGALPHQVFGTLGTQLLAESGGAAVLPDDRLVDGRTGLAVPDHRRLALVGDADGGDQIGRASCRDSVSVRVDLGGRRIIKKKNSKRSIT